jgi:hypothetical protein
MYIVILVLPLPTGHCGEGTERPTFCFFIANWETKDIAQEDS